MPAISQASFYVQGRVPSIVTVRATVLSNNMLSVHELSNEPQGYSVVLEVTKSGEIEYDGVKQYCADTCEITNVMSQTKTIDKIKVLKLSKDMLFARITIQSRG